MPLPLPLMDTMPTHARSAAGSTLGSGTDAGAGHAADATAADAAGVALLSLRAGDDCCALPLACVQEIRAFEQPTRLAHAAGCVLGVVNLRGAIVPIVDARACLGSGSGGAAPAVVIVLTIGRRTIGLAADAADEILEPGATRAQPPPAREQAAADGAVPALVQGLVPVGGRRLLLLDPAALLAVLDGGQARALP